MGIKFPTSQTRVTNPIHWDPSDSHPQRELLEPQCSNLPAPHLSVILLFEPHCLRQVTCTALDNSNKTHETLFSLLERLFRKNTARVLSRAYSCRQPFPSERLTSFSRCLLPPPAAAAQLLLNPSALQPTVPDSYALSTSSHPLHPIPIPLHI